MLFFPIGDDDRSREEAWVVYTLIFLNLVLYPFTLVEVNNGQRWMLEEFALRPSEPSPVSLVVYMFLHLNAGHLLGNMVFLWIFGDNVERALGSWVVLPVYLLLGVISGAVQLLAGTAAAVGASGAIFGIIGLYLVLFPTNRVSIFYFIIFDADIVKVPAWVFLLVFEGLQQGLGILSQNEMAFMSHLGGLGAGLLLGVVARQFQSIREFMDQPIVTAPNERAIRRKFNRRKRKGLPDKSRKSDGIFNGSFSLFNEDFVPVNGERITEILHEMNETGKVTGGKNGEKPMAFPVVNLTESAARQLRKTFASDGISLRPVPQENMVEFPPFENVTEATVEDGKIELQTEENRKTLRSPDELFLISAGRVEWNSDDQSRSRLVLDLLFVRPWLCYRAVADLQPSDDNPHVDGINKPKHVLQIIDQLDPDVPVTDETEHLREDNIDRMKPMPDLNTFEQYSLWELHRFHLDQPDNGENQIQHPT